MKWCYLSPNLRWDPRVLCHRCGPVLLFTFEKPISKQGEALKTEDIQLLLCKLVLLLVTRCHAIYPHYRVCFLRNVSNSVLDRGWRSLGFIWLCFINRKFLMKTVANSSVSEVQIDFRKINLNWKLPLSLFSVDHPGHQNRFKVFWYYLSRKHSNYALLSYLVRPTCDAYVFEFRSQNIVPMLPFWYPIVDKPSDYHLFSVFSRSVVNRLENTPTPSTLPLYPILISTLVWTCMT